MALHFNTECSKSAVIYACEKDLQYVLISFSVLELITFENGSDLKEYLKKKDNRKRSTIYNLVTGIQLKIYSTLYYYYY